MVCLSLTHSILNADYTLYFAELRRGLHIQIPHKKSFHSSTNMPSQKLVGFFGIAWKVMQKARTKATRSIYDVWKKSRQHRILSAYASCIITRCCSFPLRNISITPYVHHWIIHINWCCASLVNQHYTGVSGHIHITTMSLLLLLY